MIEILLSMHGNSEFNLQYYTENKKQKEAMNTWARKIRVKQKTKNHVLIDFYACVCVCVSVCVHMHAVLSEARRGCWIPQELGAGRKSSERAAGALSC